MAKIVCPNCNQPYEVDDNVLGEKVECAVCGTTFIAQEIKTAETETKPLTPMEQDVSVPTSSVPPEPPSGKPQSRIDKKLVALLSIGCVVIILLLVTVIVLLAQRGTDGNITYSSQPVGPLPPGTPGELLLKYAEMGETPYVAEVLKQNPSFEVDRPRADGNKTALYLACEKGYEDIVKLLLKRKADATICDSETDMKYSSLTIAARNGHLAVVKALLKSGVDIEARDEENRTALYAASAEGKKEVVKYLCESKAKVNTYGRNGWTPLTVAVTQGHGEIVKIMLKYGADLEMKHEMGGFTAIYSASIDNHPEIVEILCKAGAKVNVYGENGWTPLTVAAANGYNEVVNALLKYGQGINLELVHKYKDGDYTAIYAAVTQNHPDIVEILCKAGTKVNIYGINGWTPLTAAASEGHTDVVNALLKYGKGINLDMEGKSSQGNYTALYQAAFKNHPDIVEILCKAGANVNVYGTGGWTPLTAAADDGYVEVVNALIKFGKGIDLELRKTDSVTPLFMAIRGNFPKVVEMLCDAGANVNSYDSIGFQTPLIAAVDSGNNRNHQYPSKAWGKSLSKEKQL